MVPWFSTFGALQAAFLIAAAVLTLLVEGPLLRWLAKTGWGRAFRIAAAGLLPFFLALAGTWWFAGTEVYQRSFAWTMVMFLPIFAFFGLLLLAWVAKTVVQCRQAGLTAGLVVNLLVFPALVSVLLFTNPSVWSLLESSRPTASLADAVAREDLAYLQREASKENAPEIFRHSLRALCAPAADIAIRLGVDPDQPVVVEPYPTPRTPLVIVLAYSYSGDQALRQQELLRTLLRHGADPNLPSPRVVHYTGSPDEGKTETPLEVAAPIADPAVLAILREAGARE